MWCLSADTEEQRREQCVCGGEHSTGGTSRNCENVGGGDSVSSEELLSWIHFITVVIPLLISFNLPFVLTKVLLHISKYMCILGHQLV